MSGQLCLRRIRAAAAWAPAAIQVILPDWCALSPREVMSAVERMAQVADPAAAVALETRIGAFLSRHVLPLQAAGYGNAALDKALAATGDWAPVGTRLRWPCRGVPDEAVAALRVAARRELPELVPPGPDGGPAGSWPPSGAGPRQVLAAVRCWPRQVLDRDRAAVTLGAGGSRLSSVALSAW